MSVEPHESLQPYEIVIRTTYYLPRDLDDRAAWYGTTNPIGCWMVDYSADSAALLIDGCDGFDVISIEAKS